MKNKSPKGTVSISAQDGMLRLRWRTEGQSYALTLGLSDTALHRRIARGKASEIQADIAFERFDPTLAKYRGVAPEAAIRATGELFNLWVETIRDGGTSDASIVSRYQPLASNIKRYGLTHTNARPFIDYLRQRQSPRIANQNLGLLRAFGKWCERLQFWPTNPFSKITPAKGATEAREGKPFTSDEIRKILDTVKADRDYGHYHDVIHFLVHTGVRPGEAFDLRVSALDLESGTVTVYGSKTDSTRLLELQPSLKVILADRAAGQPAESFLFPSPQGKRINGRNFTRRCWPTICSRSGVTYRVPYFTRHSLASHLVEGGATYPQVAYILGHTDTRMVAKTYGRMINRPKMPEF